MQIGPHFHLAYSTNIHRGNSWAETFAALQKHTLEVRRRVLPGDEPFGIGLRLSNDASLELLEGRNMLEFRRWLDANSCYVFTINGFPYGNFHGSRVKEQVYVPDWQSAERLDYTNRLFRILAELLPVGMEGSVSTLPGSFKSFISDGAQVDAMCENLLHCARSIETLSESSGADLHLGLEPEPFGYVETTPETIDFFGRLRESAADSDLLQRRIGLNYDTCHMAIQFEEAATSLKALGDAAIRISKVHLSSALSVTPDTVNLRALSAFVDPVYLHQVVGRKNAGAFRRWEDLDQALADPGDFGAEDEWRIHFHVPLYAAPSHGLRTTVDHLEDTLDYFAEHPGQCSHFEFETYTWEVLPPDLRTDSVVEQLVAEYTWSMNAFATRGAPLRNKAQ